MADPSEPKIENLQEQSPPQSDPQELALVEETLADLVEDQAEGVRGGMVRLHTSLYCK
jgi:hypothetical protein